MKKIKRIGILLGILMVLSGCAMVSRAAYPAVFSKSVPIVGYPIKSNQKVVIYKTSELKTVKKKVPYCAFTITRQKGDAVYVNCKYRSRTIRGWVDKATFFVEGSKKATQSYIHRTHYLYKNTDTYEIYKTIPKYSGGATLGEKNGWYQVLFYTDNAYYLGWIPKGSYYVLYSMNTTEQILADGYYKISSRKNTEASLQYTKLKENVRLKTTKEKESQIFKITHIEDNCYTIRPYGMKGYLTMDGNRLVISRKKTYWNIIRKSRYFILQESSSGSCIGYTSKKGIFVKDLNTKSSRQHWLLKKIEVEGEKEQVTVFSQYDPKWGSSVFCNGNPARTISTSGCGAVSYVNAIFALNGQYISPELVANFSNDRGHYIYMIGITDTLYSDFAAKYGKTYHFTYAGRVNTFTALKTHLHNGGTAIAAVPGHYIAITDYRESDNSYLVLDSAVTGTRPTTIYGDWVKQSRLTYGSLACYHFHLFSTR